MPHGCFSRHRTLDREGPCVLTLSVPFCSPDEDSCQKFVPFVGVSIVRQPGGGELLGAGQSVNCQEGHHGTFFSSGLLFLWLEVWLFIL